MKKIFTPLFLLLPYLFFAQVGGLNNLLVKVDNNDNSNYLIVPMPDGGSLMVSRNDYDPNVIRLDNLNQVQWSKVFDNMSGYLLYDAGSYHDNSIYLIYWQNGKFVVLKLDAQGAVLWVDEFSLGADPYLYTTVAQLTTNGSLYFAPSVQDRVVAIALDSMGGVRHATASSVLGSFKIPGLGVGLGSFGGGYLVAGKNEGNPIEIFFDANGSVTGTNQYSNGFYNRPYSVISTSDGNYLIGGLIQNPIPGQYIGGFLRKVTPTGTELWSRRYSGTVDAASQTKLDGFIQIVENADHTISALSSDFEQFTASAHYSAIVNFDSAGHVIYATAQPADMVNYEYPKLFLLPGWQVRMSAYDYDSSTMTSHPMLIAPDWMSRSTYYCKSHSFTVTESTMPTSTPVAITFTTQSLPAPSHPSITTHDTTLAITTKALCSATTGMGTEPKQIALSLSPNPASTADVVSIKWESHQFTISEILLRDFSGRVLKRIQPDGKNEVSFAIDNLSAGLYSVEVWNNTNEKAGVKKLVISQ